MKRILLGLLLATSVLADTPGQIINKTCPASQWFEAVTPTAPPVCTQPSTTDISGLTAALAGKQNVLTIGNLTSPTGGVSISGGTGAIIGSGTTVSIATATGSNSGLLSGADWTTFNNKASSGNYITALNGDVSAAGPGLSPSTVNLVGGQTAANVASGAVAANAATSSNTANTIVKRDGSGNFSAGTITAGLTGTASNNALSSLTIATTSPLLGGGNLTTNRTISIPQASSSVSGYLSNSDWSTFNGKGAGTVTAVSVSSANGLAGSSSGGATPALTLSTTVTGVVKGNGTALSSATAGTDYSLGTSANATGIVKSTTGTGALTTAIASDFPTLNQNTTGSAGSATNLLGGAANSIPYQSGANTTVFLGQSTGVLQETAGAPSFTTAPTFTTQPYYDNSTLAATTSMVQGAIDTSVATSRLTNITGGYYSFASLGSGALLNITATAGVITSVNSIVAPGSTYAVGDLITPLAGNNDAVLRVATVSGTGVASITILNGGSGYTTLSSTTTHKASYRIYTYVLTGVLSSNAMFIMLNGTNLTQSDQWIFVNNTTGSYTVSVFLSNGSDAPTGTGVTIAQGTNNSNSSLIQSDGVTDVWFANSTTGLADVSDTNPNLNDVLSWNGTKWVNGPPVISSAGSAVVEWYATPVTIATGTQNVNQVATLNISPVTTTLQTAASSLATNTLLNSAWETGAAMGRTSIPGGQWSFNVYCGTSATNGGRTTTFTNNVYQVIPGATGSYTLTTTGSGATRTATVTGASFVSGDASATNTVSGYLQTSTGLFQITAYSSATVVTIATPTTYTNQSAVQFYKWANLFGATSAAITSITPAYSLNTVQIAEPAFTVAATDYLGSILFATGNNTLTFTMAYNGTVTNTNMGTTLNPVHNSLAGLQGGTGNQYYHLTSAEYTGSGTGVFARVDAPTFIAPTLGAAMATSLAASGTVTGSNLSGTNTGDQIITLTGDVTGTGSSTFATHLSSTGVVAGSYTSANITVNSTGRITAASNGSGGGGAVSSVSNSDGSLTISPTTGSVFALLNTAHANTFTATQTMAPSATTSKAEVIKRKASSSVNTWEIQNPSGTPMFYADDNDNIDVATDLIFHNIAGGSLVALNGGNHLIGINTLNNLSYNYGSSTLSVTTYGGPGVIQFTGNTSNLYGDSLFKWDDSNFRLGVNQYSPAHTLDVVGDGKFLGAAIIPPVATSASGAIVYSESGSFGGSAYTTDATTQRGYQLYSKKTNIDTTPYYSPTGLSFGPFVDNGSQITTSQVSGATIPSQDDFAGSYGPADGTTNVEYQLYSWQTVNGVTVVSASYLYMNMGGDNSDGNNYGVSLDWSTGVPPFNPNAAATGYFLIRQINGGGYNDYMVPPGVTFVDDGSTGWNISSLPTLTPTSTPDFYQIDLAWTAVTDPAVTGYRLFYSPTNFVSENGSNPSGLGASQIDGSGSYTANGLSYQYWIYAVQTVAGVQVFSPTPAQGTFYDNSDGQPFSWQLSWSPATLVTGGSSLSYIVEVLYGGNYFWQNVGNVTSFLDSGAGYTFGPPTVTPNSIVPVFYTDLSGYTSASFIDTSYNILTPASTYPPTPIASTPSVVTINPPGAAIDIQGGYQFPAVAPPGSNYLLLSGSGDTPMSWQEYSLTTIPGTLGGSQIAYGSGNGQIINYGSGNLNTAPFTFDAGNLYHTIRGPTFLAFEQGLQVSSNAGSAEWQIYSPYVSSRYDLSMYNVGGSGGYGEFMHVRDDTRDITFTGGNVSLTVVGKGLGVKEGTNGKQGVCTLVLGTCTVSTTTVTSTSRIFVTAQSLGTITVPAAYAISARTAGTSFTILSSNLTDTSTVAYEIFESP